MDVTTEAPTEGWAAWDDFLAATPATGFMQSSWWADFRTSAGYAYAATIVRHEGAIAGGALVHTYHHAPDACFYYVPEGPVLPRDPRAARAVFATFLHAIAERQRAESAAVSHLRIEPRWTELPEFVVGFRPPRCADRFVEPRDTLCVDLRASDEQLLARMKPKGRYNAGLAGRHGVVVVEDTSARGLADFLHIYEDTAAREGFEPRPRDYFGELVTVLASVDRGRLYFAEYEGQRLACALVVSFGERATYFFGGSLLDHRSVMAPYLLHLEIMRAERDRGVREYDLWGVAPALDAASPWPRFSAFKGKLGGAEVHLVPTLDFVLDEAEYRRYLEIEGQPGRD